MTSIMSQGARPGMLLVHFPRGLLCSHLGRSGGHLHACSREQRVQSLWPGWLGQGTGMPERGALSSWAWGKREDRVLGGSRAPPSSLGHRAHSRMQREGARPPSLGETLAAFPALAATKPAVRAAEQSRAAPGATREAVAGRVRAAFSPPLPAGAEERAGCGNCSGPP